MSIPVTCPNGHEHRVKNSLAGKVGLCPNCKAPIHVPERSGDDALMDILNPNESGLSGSSLSVEDPGADSGEVWPRAAVQPALKVCPKCHSEIPGEANICPNCRTYVASLM